MFFPGACELGVWRFHQPPFSMNLTPDLARIAHEIGNELPNGQLMPRHGAASQPCIDSNNLTIQRSLSNRFNWSKNASLPPLRPFLEERDGGEVAFIDPTLSGHQPITLNHQPSPSKQPMPNYLTLILNAISSPATAARPSFGARLSPAAARVLDDHAVSFRHLLHARNNNRRLFLPLWRLQQHLSAAPPAFLIEQMGIKVHLTSELSEYGKRLPKANDHPLLSMRKSLRGAPPERRPARISMSRLRQSRDFRSGRLETARNAHYQKMTRKRGGRS